LARLLRDVRGVGVFGLLDVVLADDVRVVRVRSEQSHGGGERRTR
jgi:hypothetical protein